MLARMLAIGYHNSPKVRGVRGWRQTLRPRRWRMAWSHGDPARRGHIERLAGIHHGQYGSGMDAMLAG
jgi:hypothetical protein